MIVRCVVRVQMSIWEDEGEEGQRQSYSRTVKGHRMNNTKIIVGNASIRLIDVDIPSKDFVEGEPFVEVLSDRSCKCCLL